MSLIECFLRGGEKNGQVEKIPMLAEEVFIPFSMAHYGRYLRTPEIIRLKEFDGFVGTYRVYLYDDEKELL